MEICFRKAKHGLFQSAELCFESIYGGAARLGTDQGEDENTRLDSWNDADQVTFLPAQWIFFGVILKNIHHYTDSL